METVAEVLPDVTYGRLQEAGHLGGYTIERLYDHLESMLEGDRWKQVGGGRFKAVNDFLRSIDLSQFNLGDKRPKLHRLIRELQPEASNRAIADMTGTAETTVRRDTATSVAAALENDAENESEDGESATNVAPVQPPDPAEEAAPPDDIPPPVVQPLSCDQLERVLLKVSQLLLGFEKQWPMPRRMSPHGRQSVKKSLGDVINHLKKLLKESENGEAKGRKAKAPRRRSPARP